MPSALSIRSTLQPTELGQNHREFVVDVTDCVEHCDAQYGCTDVACRQVHLILDSERPRGQCGFIRTNNKLYVSYTVNESRACLRSKEIRSAMHAKHHGHAAAASQVNVELSALQTRTSFTYSVHCMSGCLNQPAVTPALRT